MTHREQGRDGEGERDRESEDRWGRVRLERLFSDYRGSRQLVIRPSEVGVPLELTGRTNDGVWSLSHLHPDISSVPLG